LIVTPGVRPTGAALWAIKTGRDAGPSEIKDGRGSYLVGRPHSGKAEDPQPPPAGSAELALIHPQMASTR